MQDRYARSIAARGLTPNDIGKVFSYPVAGIVVTGMIRGFEHETAEQMTHISYLYEDQRCNTSFQFLEAITVYDR
jgi:hypothetical protein